MKKGLGLALGGSTLGLTGLMASPSALAWGPWYNFTCNPAQTSIMKVLLPGFKSFWGKWKNSDDAMTKQLCLYARSDGDQIVTIGDSYYNVENKTGYVDKTTCYNLDICFTYKSPVYEKIYTDGRVGIFQIDGKDRSGGNDEFRRNLQSNLDYTSPTRFTVAWALAKANGYTFVRKTITGFVPLGILLTETIYQNGAGVQVFFYEYAVYTESRWFSFCTADQAVLAKIAGGVNLFTSNLSGAIGTLGDAAKIAAVGAAAGYGYANLASTVSQKQNNTILVSGGNVTDTTYLRGSSTPGQPTSHESAASIAAAITFVTGTAMAAAVYPKYMAHYRGSRNAIILMMSLVGLFSNPPTDSVYGSVPFES